MPTHLDLNTTNEGDMVATKKNMTITMKLMTQGRLEREHLQPLNTLSINMNLT